MCILRSVKVRPISFGIYMHSVVCRVTEAWNSCENNCCLGRGEAEGVGLLLGCWKVVRGRESLCSLLLANPSKARVCWDNTGAATVLGCIALKDYGRILSAFPAGRKALPKHWRNHCYCQFRGNRLTLEKGHSEPFFRKHKLRRCGWWSGSGTAAVGALKQVRKEQLASPVVTCFCVCPSSPSFWHSWAATICTSLFVFALYLSSSAALTLLVCSPLLLGVWIRCWEIEDSLL